MEKSIVVLGSINYDIVASADRLPTVGETVNGRTVDMFVGGKGANQAVQSALAGAKTYFIGLVGDDEQGKRVRQGLLSKNVDDRFLQTSTSYRTGCASIYLNPEGDNMLVYAPGANHHISKEQIESARDIIASANIFITQNEVNADAVLYGLQLARKSGVRTILNPAPALALDDSLYSLIDYITPNETESEYYTGLYRKDMPFEQWKRANAEWFLTKGVKNICITLGEKGAYFFNGQEEFSVPAFSIKAIDTTAAGDSFNGGFAVGLAQGWTYEKCLQFGSACGAMAAMTLGAQNSIQNYEKLSAFLKENAIVL